jgi:hypothetical protein
MRTKVPAYAWWTPAVCDVRRFNIKPDENLVNSMTRRANAQVDELANLAEEKRLAVGASQACTRQPGSGSVTALRHPSAVTARNEEVFYGGPSGSADDHRRGSHAPHCDEHNHRRDAQGAICIHSGRLR